MRVASPALKDANRPHPCQPEELLICGVDDPERQDRLQGLQSLLLEIADQGAADALQAALRQEED